MSWPSRTMITFDVPGARFNARVGGICLRDGHILLQSADGWTYWVPPGGRWEMGETSEESLLREMREEIDSDVTIERLLWFSENLFEHEARYWHEIALYYLITIPEPAPHLALDAIHRTMDGRTEIYVRWFPIDRLPRVFPLFLPEGLQHLPEHPERIVTKEISD